MKKYLLALLLTLLCNVSFSNDIKLKDSDAICTKTISLNGNSWRIAIDSSNVEIQNAWFKTPPVSMGWDASPRCMQSDKFEQKDYPWTPVFVGNRPSSFQQQLTEAKSFLDKYNPKHKILVLNSWNEWTEGSYLLPEKKYGDAYLKAIKAVFVK